VGLYTGLDSYVHKQKKGNESKEEMQKKKDDKEMEA